MCRVLSQDCAVSDDSVYEAITCALCKGVHLVSAKTGRVIRQNLKAFTAAGRARARAARRRSDRHQRGDPVRLQNKRRGVAVSYDRGTIKQAGCSSTDHGSGKRHSLMWTDNKCGPRPKKPDRKHLSLGRRPALTGIQRADERLYAKRIGVVCLFRSRIRSPVRCGTRAKVLR